MPYTCYIIAFVWLYLSSQDFLLLTPQNVPDLLCSNKDAVAYTTSLTAYFQVCFLYECVLNWAMLHMIVTIYTAGTPMGMAYFHYYNDPIGCCYYIHTYMLNMIYQWGKH